MQYLALYKIKIEKSYKHHSYSYNIYIFNPLTETLFLKDVIITIIN
jgi:hypothetical protein